MSRVYRALNTNILVKDLFDPQKDREVLSTGGIIIETINPHSDMSKSEGIIEDIGPNAFEDFGERKPKLGDRVVYARYAGKELSVYSDGLARRILRDLDILATVEETEDK